ncbi:HD family phosphohydrolase [candidate division KSB1 bacterium]
MNFLKSKNNSFSPKNISNLKGHRNTVIKTIIAGVVILGSIYLLPNLRFEQYSDFKLGSIAPQEIIAPFDFYVLKSEEELKADIDREMVNIFPVFYDSLEIQHNTVSSINAFFLKLDSIQFIMRRLTRLGTDVSNQMNNANRIQSLREYTNQRDNIFESIRNNYQLNITDDRFKFLLEAGKSNVNYLKNNILNIINELYGIGIINIKKEELDNTKKFISLRTGNNEYQKNFNEFFDIEEAKDKVSERFQAVYGDSAENKIGYEIVSKVFMPNLFYDKSETERLEERAIASISKEKDFVQKNTRIVNAHDEIDQDTFDKIQSLRLKNAEYRTRINYALPLLGNSIFIIALFSFFIIYLYYFRLKIFKDNKMFFLSMIILFSQVFFVYLIVNKLNSSYLLIPTTITSILLTTLFDGGVGLYGTVVTSLLMGVYLDISFEIVFLSFIAGVSALYAVNKIRTRSQFYRSTIYIALSYFIILVAFALLRSTPAEDVIKDFTYFSLANAIFSPMISAGFLGIFEKIFGITTNLTLLELSDLNNPLLKELLIKASGTYNHSIIMGNLAEAAAESIKANSLLARVGAYYHDIGKMEKPIYFVENQMDGRNIHETISPRVSSLVLLSHVKIGVELAEKYKLPDIIKDFIAQHHGTTKMAFFFKKAKESLSEKYLNESDYKYPGPTPQSKEIGIVMLADSVEAATRSLEEPTPKKIEDTVRQIVLNKFKEGQLDDCELTVREISKITLSFTKLITGFYHRRIVYPGQEETDKRVIFSDEK